MNSFIFKTLLFLTALTTNLVRADTPATHGMLLFGDQVTYASHLPMFHSPHDYQLIMKLTLTNLPRSETIKSYENFKKRGETFFTLVPEVMDLSQIINGAKTGFSASIYKGHFERGGQSLGVVKVRVEKVIFSKKLDGSKAPADSDQYLLFGETGEYFAVHLIQGKPSFDEILKVSQPYELEFSHCRTRVCADPPKNLISDALLPITVTDQESDSGSHLPVMGGQIGEMNGPIVDVLKVIYIEEAELAH